MKLECGHYEVGSQTFLGFRFPDDATCSTCGHRHESVTSAVNCLHERYPAGTSTVILRVEGTSFKNLTFAEEAERIRATRMWKEQRRTAELLKEQERVSRLKDKEYIPLLKTIR